MIDNVIDGRDRFPGNRQPPKSNPIEMLRQTARVAPVDRVSLAVSLGNIAAQLDPGKPGRAAKTWFAKAWTGERWAKRKRMIVFPGEQARDFNQEGAFVASGAEWAALIHQAVLALHPGTDAFTEENRARATRHLLRGTSYLPKLPASDSNSDDAQSLMAAYAHETSLLIDRETKIRALWTALSTNPFTIEEFKVSDIVSGDPLAAAASAATAVWGPHPTAGMTYRFRPGARGKFGSWHHPAIKLGVRAHRRTTRIFTLPKDFAESLPVSSDANFDACAEEEHAVPWLLHNGIISDKARLIPGPPYDRNKGYGWREFKYEILQNITLSLRQKKDGTVGMWLEGYTSEFNEYYVVLPSARGSVEFGPALWAWDTDSLYKYLFPYGDYSDGDSSSPVPVRGFIEETESFEGFDVGGWIDDFNNDEVRDLLLGTGDSLRFVPTWPMDRNLPPPCGEGTIASALLQNLSVAPDDRMIRYIMKRASCAASAGLAYHNAVLGHYRMLIDRLGGNTL